ncbi:uncharacterized protein LOC132997081 [Limanda limanda]|uniref:uncharacterized protein LOC132997081 n=1 Tax=Limanda limanda TaxID=27771 RepID=UPI0029C92460|nr:uncharacterized protein LOC132997081 [Limanda limanda]
MTVFNDVSAGITYYTANEGETLIVKYSFRSYGSRKLCRGPCEAGEVLIETEENEARNGRYSIKYEKTGEAEGDLTVTFTQVSKSDSGTYQCGLGNNSSLYREFGILVTDDSTTTSPSSSSSFTRSSASPETTDQSEDQTPETTGADTSFSTKNLILTVGLTLVVMVILLSGSALMFCRNRTNRPREPPVETDPASVPEPDPVYEDFRDEGRPPAAVEISPDYSYVKYSTTQPVTAGDDYNFVTAATSQHNADDSSG